MALCAVPIAQVSAVAALSVAVSVQRVLLESHLESGASRSAPGFTQCLSPPPRQTFRRASTFSELNER